jgi:UDP-N-acetylglucosamine:LPS N-acetylglucosamine transferase
VLLVCSPGGHTQQMLALEPAWSAFKTTWVTVDGPEVEHLLAEGNVEVGHGPTERHLPNFVRNLRFAWRTIRKYRPDAILSTGSGLSVPFFIVGKLMRRRLIYVESLTRIDALSLSGRLVYPLADEFFVQWPTAARLRRARFEGSVL